MTENSKDLISLEKVKVLNTIIASIFIPVAVLVIGNWYSMEMKKRETQVRYVELAIGILAQEPNDKLLSTRKWAIDVVNKYSEVPINDDTRNELEKQIIPKPIDSSKIFTPQEPISRAEAIKLIALSAIANRGTIDLNDHSNIPFKDVSPEEWYKPYLK